MKKLILFYLFIAPLFLSGQINSSITIVSGIDYTYRKLHDPGNAKVPKSIYDLRQKIESGKLNYRFGLNYNRHITCDLWLETGFRIASIGYNYIDSDVRFESEYQPDGTWIPDPNLPERIRFSYDYQFLEIPVGLRYVFGHKKWKTYAAVGLSSNFYLITYEKQISKVDRNVTKEKSSGFKKVTFSANIGFGLDYAVSQNYQIFVQPSFRYHFTKLVEAQIKEFLYGAGLEFGVRRNLKKTKTH